MGNRQTSSANRRSGTLYIVSTPIGNLDDITLRALKTLKDVDLIAAESVKHSKGLRDRFGIKTGMLSYNQHNHKKRAPHILDMLKRGRNVALITSAGTPGISDPGTLLVSQAHEQDIRVMPVPGPSAALAALSASGLRSDRFLFLGFLSNRPGRRKKELRELTSETRTMVFFEAPHRMPAFLADVGAIMGDRRVAVFRELTKVYEQGVRGPVSMVMDRMEPGILRGEFTVVLEGRPGPGEKKGLDAGTKEKIEILLRDNKMTLKDVAGKLSEEKGLSYRTLYKACLSIKKTMALSD